MFFEKFFTLSHFPLYDLPDQGVAFELGGPHKIRVRFRHPSAEEVSQGHSPGKVFCSAHGEWDPNPKVRQIFEDLAAHRVPEGSKIPVAKYRRARICSW